MKMGRGCTGTFRIPTAGSGLYGMAFSDVNRGVVVGDNLTAWFTTDGGKTWYEASIPGVEKTLLRDAAFVPYEPAGVIVADNGVILSSEDWGGTWVARESGTTDPLHAVVWGGDAWYAAGNDGLILRSTNSDAQSWSVEITQTSVDFRGLSAVGNEVWAVASDGSIFYRQPTPISGPLSVVEADDLDYGRVGTIERPARSLRVANEGTSNLVASVIADNPHFGISPSGPVNIAPGEAAFFVVEANPAAGDQSCALRVTTSDGLGGGQLPVTASMVTDDKFTSLLGYVTCPATLNLGRLLMGTTLHTNILISNTGQSNVLIFDLTMRSRSTNAICTLNHTPSGSLAPGASGQVLLDFVPTQPGTYRGQIKIASNARNGDVAIECLAEVVAQPDVVVFDSVPPGAPLLVGATWITNSTAYTVVDTAPGIGQLRRGTPVTVNASSAYTSSGASYVFHRWVPDPGDSGATFAVTAGSSAPRYVAHYVQSPAEATVTNPNPAAAACAFEPPTDVTFGPWVKVSKASLTLPWLGEDTNRFQVEGALFLSLTRACGSLQSGRIRVLVPADFPALANAEVLEITSGAWEFDIEEGHFRLASLSPGLQVFDQSVAPPAELVFDADLTTGGQTIFGRFATLDDLPLVPGLLVLGPSSAELGLGLTQTNQAFFHLSLDGSVKALPKPDGSGWIVNQNCGFHFDASGNLAPIPLAQGLLADLAVLRLHAMTDAQIGPQVSKTGNRLSFSLVADHLGVELFRSGQILKANSILDSDGTFYLEVGIPSGGLECGPVRLKSGTPYKVIANALQARLAVHLPNTDIVSPTAYWPDDVLTAPEIDFDTADFSLKLPLPSLTLNLNPDIGMQGAALDEDNYFEFTRCSDQTIIKLCNRQDLYIGAMQLGLSLTTAGGFSGHLSGRLGVPGPYPLSEVSDSISMNYDSAAPEWPFTLRRNFLGIDCELRARPFDACACALFTGWVCAPCSP